MADERARDLILAPNEFAFVSNEANAVIETYVGPHKTSLAKECQPVLFDSKSKRFVRCSLEQAVQVNPIAPEGWYLVLKNPTLDNKHPKERSRNDSADLQVGRKINIPGPAGFALFPGQMVRVIQGHHLRSNQYLLVRVYDDEAAKKNAAQAIVKPADGNEIGVTAGETKAVLTNFTMGALNIIKGTEVSFYIPPTGIEVIPDEHGNYIREAITLERLEYTILLDENGGKEYPVGPQVVFPKPTQKFVQRNGFFKFRAVELNPNMGIYVKVNAAYSEDTKGKVQNYEIGDEIFITGKETKIYFPREEHSIIKQGESTIHYAIAIPKGEARYVLNKDTGEINMVRGPKMFLPDPRREVIVRRILGQKDVDLWFPGNTEAKTYNAQLSEVAKGGEAFVREPALEKNLKTSKYALNSLQLASNAFYAAETRSASDELAVDSMQRKTQFTPPHTVTLETKYDGAVCINVWPGYAVQVVRRTGEREVIIGPRSILLDYDAKLEVLSLSTGKPKTTDKLLETVYLQVKHNLVSDIVKVVTKDMVTCNIKLSYRVNFEGEPSKWFMVSNYVKYMCDHLRSLLGNMAKSRTVEELNADTVTLVRDTILGKSGEKGEKRPLRNFEENGMVVYDVEILDFSIGDVKIASLLQQAQTESVRQTLELANAQRDLEIIVKLEKIKRERHNAVTATSMHQLTVQKEIDAQRNAAEEATKKFTLMMQQVLDDIANHERNRAVANDKAQIESEKERLAANVAAFVDKMKAVDPSLIAAITSAAKMGLAEKLAENLPKMPSTLFGVQGIQALGEMVKNTPLADAIDFLKNGSETANVSR